MWEFSVTFFLFFCTLCLLPLLFITFIVVRLNHKIWLNCVSILYPEVEFLKYSTIRTLLDTHRNQGIISVLLNVKGSPQPEMVKRNLKELVRRRDKFGNIAFPRLRHCLITKCGTYAWIKGKFDLDQNILMVPCMFKGRSITEHNIQEYVSDIVSKYLPNGIPPWQMIIIPSSEDNHYILLKLHHVLLSEGINIGDLLPLIPPTRQTSAFTAKSPLIDVFKKPTFLPILKDRLTEELTNRWNEFVSNYDPLEHPQLLKQQPTFLQFQAILLITLVSLTKECRKGFRVIKNDLYSKLKYIFVTLKRETTKRQVTIENFFLSLFSSLYPSHLVTILIKNVCFLLFVLPVRIPMTIYGECVALYTCITLQYCSDSSTFVGFMYNYVPLFFNSLKELIYLVKIVFSAPRTIVRDVLMQNESFETITLCGRKSVAWSAPIRIEFIKALAKYTEVSEIEVVLAALSGTISRYLFLTNHVIPDELAVTLRNVNSNFVLGTGNNVKHYDSVSGILFMNLPMIDPEKDTTCVENLMEIKSRFAHVVSNQGISHLLSMLQTKTGILTKILPQTVLSVYLKYLSRKYAISITEVSNRYPNVRQKTIWGQEVTDVIYWRPPQANTSISLCLNEYADHLRLGVMCDAQLVPHHAVLANSFTDSLFGIAKASGL